MRLENRTAVITGGASGMGRDTAMRFLEEGANVVVADYNAKTGEEAVELAAQAGFGDRIRFRRVDVAREADVEAVLALAVEVFRGLDIVFNNAGVGGAHGPIVETTTEAWDYTFDVNAKGVFYGIKHGARILKAQGRGGSIINTASIAGLSGDGGPVVYSAAKAAVISLTKSTAIELAPERIRVNAICPGFIATPLAAGGAEKVNAVAAAFEDTQPIPGPGLGEHIAGAALYLASDDSTFVTGEAIVVDGGLTAEGPGISKRFPAASGRHPGFAGVTRGSTGEAW